MFELYRAIGMLKEIASQLKEQDDPNWADGYSGYPPPEAIDAHQAAEDLRDSALAAVEEAITRIKLLCD